MKYNKPASIFAFEITKQIIPCLFQPRKRRWRARPYEYNSTRTRHVLEPMKNVHVKPMNGTEFAEVCVKSANCGGKNTFSYEIHVWLAGHEYGKVALPKFCC